MRREDGKNPCGDRKCGRSREGAGMSGGEGKILSDRQLRDFLRGGRQIVYREENLRQTIDRAKDAFAKREGAASLSALEFLYQQGQYIRRRWWALQAGVLFLLWGVLQLAEPNVYIQRCMGIAASLFAALLLPELWKNRNAGAMEVEGTTYYSLKQIYGARFFLCGLVDLLLLSGFSLAVVLTGKLLWEELLTQFLLPYVVACCICFRCLYSRLGGSEMFALFLCMAWTAIWVQIVLREEIYETVSLPVWLGLLAAAVFYLGYCLYRGQRECKKIWEGKALWN